MGASSSERGTFLSDSMLLDRTFRRSPTFAPKYCLAAATGFGLCWLIIQLTVPQVPEHLAAFEELVPPIVFQSQAAAFTAVLLVNALNVAFSRDSTRTSCNWLLVLVNFVALTTHLLVSLNLTPVVLGPTGIYFHPLRYCCWSFSTPTLLVLLSSMSDISSNQLQFAIVSDVIMILTGLGAVWTTNCWQTANTIVSFLTFIPVLWYMSLMFDSAIHATEDHSTRFSLRVLSGTCMFVWSAFPTVWLLAFCHIITPEQEQIGLGLCDFVAKAIFSSQLWQGNVMTIQQRTEVALRAWQESNSMLIMHKLRKLLTARDVLVHSLSHELQTPIKGIVALTTDLLKGLGSPAPKQQDYDKMYRTNLSTIRSSGVCLLDIISSALDAVSNPVPPQQLTGELVRLQSLAAGVVHIVTPLLPGHIQLSNEVPLDLPCVDSNRRALMRVLLNMTGALIQNSLVKGRVALRAKQEDNTVLVQVVALDVVLDEDCLHKLLYPFAPGTGHIMSDMTGDTMAANPPLFLFLLRNFLESHAPLSAKATPQTGTTFSFRLPIADADDLSVSSTHTSDLLLPSLTDMQLVAEVQRALRNGRSSTDSARSTARPAHDEQRTGTSKTSSLNGFVAEQRQQCLRGESSDTSSPEEDACYQDAEEDEDDDAALAVWHQQHMDSLMQKHTEGSSSGSEAHTTHLADHSAPSGQDSGQSSRLARHPRQSQSRLGKHNGREAVQQLQAVGGHGGERVSNGEKAAARNFGNDESKAAAASVVGSSVQASARRASELFQAGAGKHSRPAEGSGTCQQATSGASQLRRSFEQVVEKVRNSWEAVLGHSSNPTGNNSSGREANSAAMDATHGHTVTSVTPSSTSTVSATDVTDTPQLNTHGSTTGTGTGTGSLRLSSDSRRVSFESRKSSLSKWRNEKGARWGPAPRQSIDYVEGTPGYAGRGHEKVHRFWLATKPKMPHRQKHGVVQVLCVDDNIINQLIAEAVLKAQHWKVIKAMSGEQALDYVLNKADVLPDVLLLDVMMPGINGFDVCSRLREFYPSSILPIMMLTTSMSESNVVEGLKCGADDYVAKPYKRAELTSRIRAHLRARDDIHELHNHLSTWQLLHNLLPADVKLKLRSGQNVVPERVDAVVLVVHICDVCQESALIPPSRLMTMLNQLLAAFGKICTAHGVQLVDFTGYGLTVLHVLDKDTGPSVQDVVQVGVEILQRAQPLVWPSGKPLRLQVAVHCGAATVGVVEQEVLKYLLVGEAITLAEQLVHAVPPGGFFVSQPVVFKCYDTTIFTDEPVAHSPSGVACYLVKSPGWQAALDEMSSHETWPLKNYTHSPPHAVHSSGMMPADVASSPRIPATPATEGVTGHAASAAPAAPGISHVLAAAGSLPADLASIAHHLPHMTAGPHSGLSLLEVMRMMTDIPSRNVPATSMQASSLSGSSTSGALSSHLPASAGPTVDLSITAAPTVDPANVGNLSTSSAAPSPWISSLLLTQLQHAAASLTPLIPSSSRADLLETNSFSRLVAQCRASLDSTCTSDGTSSTSSSSTRNSVSLPAVPASAGSNLSNTQTAQITQAVLQHQIVTAWQQLQQLTLQLQQVNSWLSCPPAMDQGVEPQHVASTSNPDIIHMTSEQSKQPALCMEQQPPPPPQTGQLSDMTNMQPQSLNFDGACSATAQSGQAGGVERATASMPVPVNAIPSSVIAPVQRSLHIARPLSAVQLQNRFLQATPTLAQPSLPTFSLGVTPAVSATPPAACALFAHTAPAGLSGAAASTSSLQLGMSPIPEVAVPGSAGSTPAKVPLPPPHRPASSNSNTTPLLLQQCTPPPPNSVHGMNASSLPMQGLSVSSPLGVLDRNALPSSRDASRSSSSAAAGSFTDRLLAYCSTVGSFHQTEDSAASLPSASPILTSPSGNAHPNSASRDRGVGGEQLQLGSAGVAGAHVSGSHAPSHQDRCQAITGEREDAAGKYCPPISAVQESRKMNGVESGREAVVQQTVQAATGAELRHDVTDAETHKNEGGVSAAECSKAVWQCTVGGERIPLEDGVDEVGGAQTAMQQVDGTCGTDAARDIHADESGTAAAVGSSGTSTGVQVDDRLVRMHVGAGGSGGAWTADAVVQRVALNDNHMDAAASCGSGLQSDTPCVPLPGAESEAGCQVTHNHMDNTTSASVAPSLPPPFVLPSSLQRDVGQLRDVEPADALRTAPSKVPDMQNAGDADRNTDTMQAESSGKAWEVSGDVDLDQKLGVLGKPSLLLAAHALQDAEGGSSGQSSPDAPSTCTRPAHNGF